MRGRCGPSCTRSCVVFLITQKLLTAVAQHYSSTRTGVSNSTAEIAHRICTAAAAPQPAASGKQGARLPTSAAKFQPGQAVRGSGQKNQTRLARSDWGPSDARARGYRLRPVCQRCCSVHGIGGWGRGSPAASEEFFDLARIFFVGASEGQGAGCPRVPVPVPAPRLRLTSLSLPARDRRLYHTYGPRSSH